MKKILSLILIAMLAVPAVSSAIQPKTYVRKILLLDPISAASQPVLMTKTSASQSRIIQMLDSFKLSGDVLEYRPYWIQNAISVAGTAQAIQKITQDSGIGAIDDAIIHVETVHAKKTDVEWNLKAVGAPDIWATGNKGKGALIGVLDSGCDITHPELKGKVTNFAYFDDYGRKGSQTVAFDDDGHGTMVSSVIAGTTVGVAPEANLIVGCVLPGGSGNLSQILGGLQWIADPDNDSSTHDAPVAVNMSFGMPSVEEYLKPSIDNLIDLGILPIASIGNDGEGSTSNPGNLPEVLSVGSVNSSLKASSFSSGDTVIWETFDDSMTVTKPDICAPGEGIRMAALRKTYDIADGTSFSAPHVAGICALVASQNPGIGVEDLKSAITQTATDLGAPGRDSRYGLGMINAKAAIDQVKSRTPRTIKITKPSDKTIFGDVTIKTPDRTYTITPELAENFTYLSTGSPECQIETFGFRPVTTSADSVELEALPTHRVTISTVSPLLDGFTESTILLKDSPFMPFEAPDGTLVVGLPEGKHTFLISSFGHTMMRIEKDITGDTEFTVNLEPAKLGFIDGRRSYFGSQPVPIKGKLKPALDASGLPWFYWSLASGKVTANQLSRFPYLVWNSGSTLDTKEIDILSQYLDGGGKLVLTSSFFGASYFGETPTTPFLASYFHCTGLEDGGMTVKWTKQGNFRSLALTTLWGFASSSRLMPTDDQAKPFLTYAGNEASSYAGLRISTPKTQGIILGFTFPDISSIDDAKWLMKLCIDSFDETVTWNTAVTDPSGKPLSGTAKVLGTTMPFTDGELLIPHIPANGAQVLINSYGSSSFSAQVSSGNLPKSIILQPAKLGQLKLNLNTNSWLILEDTPVNPKLVQAQSQLDLPEGTYQVTLAAKGFKSKNLNVRVPGNLNVQLEKKELRVLTTNPTQRMVQAFGALRLPFEAQDDITAGDIIGSQAFVWSSSLMSNSKTAKIIENVKTALKCDAGAIIMGQALASGWGDPVNVDASSTPVFSIMGSDILGGMLISTSIKDSSYQTQAVPVISGGTTIASFIGIGSAMAKFDKLTVSAVSFEMLDLEVVGQETLRRMLAPLGVQASLPQGKILSGTNPTNKPEVNIIGVAVPLSQGYIRIDGRESPIELDPEGFFSYQANLSEGTHKIEIVSKTTTGLISVSQPANIVVDMTPPKLRVYSPRGGNVATNDVELISSVEGASIVSIDGAAFKPEGKLIRTKIPTGSGSIFIQLSDDAGNKLEKTVTYSYLTSTAFDSAKTPFWFEINQLVASGITGLADKFEPDRVMTRFEAAVWLAKLLDLAPVSGQTYTDLKADQPETGYINSLVKQGILSGKGKFEGAKPAAREFVITILANSVKTNKSLASVKFSDLPSSNPYYKAIAKAQTLGIIKQDDKRLFPGGKFGLGQASTRLFAAVAYYQTMIALAKGE